MLSCTNCERELGNLEQQFDYNGHSVCAQCHQSLSLTAAVGQVTAARRYKPKKRKDSSGVIAVTIVTAVVGLGVGAYFVFRPQPPAAPQPTAEAKTLTAADVRAIVTETKVADLINEGNRHQAVGKPAEALAAFRQAVQTIEQSPTPATQAKLPNLNAAIQRLEQLQSALARTPTAPPKSLFSDPAADLIQASATPAEQPAPEADHTGPAPVEISRPIETNPKNWFGDDTAVIQPPNADTLKQGWALVAKRRFGEAKPLFQPLTIGAQPSPEALHGLATCLYRLDKDKKAAQAAIDKAVQLAPHDATIVHNAAVMYLDTIPMRSAKLLRAYLADPSHPLNENLQNLLGAALSRADAQARKLPFFAESFEFYFTYDQRLEAGKSQRRWGSQWIDADDAKAKWARIRQAAARLDSASQEYRTAIVQTRQESSRLNELLGGTGTRSDTDYSAAQTRFKQASADETKAQQHYQTAREGFLQAESPPFPESFKLLTPGGAEQ